MNSLRPLEEKTLVNQVISIIDTKIQYIDYQTNHVVSSIIGTELQNVPRPSVDVSEISNFNFSYNNCDSFLTLMEEYSRTKSLLLTLRQHTNHKTAQLIFDLLSDNQFIAFTDKELEVMVKGKDKK